MYLKTYNYMKQAHSSIHARHKSRKGTHTVGMQGVPSVTTPRPVILRSLSDADAFTTMA